MKPYMILEGNHLGLEAFEKKIADALEAGYSLAGELIAHTAGTEVKFYQPMLLSDDFDEDWDEDEDEDEEDEDEA